MMVVNAWILASLIVWGCLVRVIASSFAVTAAELIVLIALAFVSKHSDETIRKAL